jgi:YVTN family beta-propeller protein
MKARLVRRVRFPKLAPVFALAVAACASPTELPPPPGPYAASLTIVAGAGQAGVTGIPLPTALVVAVADSVGAPFQGTKVRFVVTSGGGSVEPESVLTGFDGRAQAVWTLGSTVGAQRVEARVDRQGRSTLSAEYQAVAVQLARPSGTIAATRTIGFRPYGVAVSAQGIAYVTQLDAGTLTGANANTLALAGTVAVGSTPTDVAFNPAGTTAYVTNQLDGALGVVDVATGVQVATIPLGGNPFDVAVSPDGTRLYVSTNANQVVVVNAATRTVIGTIATSFAPMRMAWHPNGTRLYVATIFGGVVHEISVATLTVTRTFSVGGTPQGMAVSPDGAELYVANETGRIDIWSLVSGSFSASIPLLGGGYALAMTKDATQLYVSIPGRGLVAVVDRVGRTVVNQVGTGGDPRDIAFSADGLTALVANTAGWVNFVR